MGLMTIFLVGRACCGHAGLAAIATAAAAAAPAPAPPAATEKQQQQQHHQQQQDTCTDRSPSLKIVTEISSHVICVRDVRVCGLIFIHSSAYCYARFKLYPAMHVQRYSIQRERVSTIDHRVVALSAIGKIGAIARA